ncbi:MAG: winged helix-turn-helix domain-containing protein [Rhodobacter sp.]|nr:winged helix-turn-helix domain-containing protein [Rhodobacter sp.]
MSGIEITRRDLTAGELRGAAGKSRDAKAARRMLALALVLEGVDRTRAAETCGMDRQTLRGEKDQETVRGTVSPTNGHRYTAEGLAGLSDRWNGVRDPRLSPAQMAELGAWVGAGPHPARDGVVRWRRQDLQRRIATAYGIEVHERTVGKYLASPGYRSLSVRPQHPKSDPGAQAAFKKTSPKR